MSQTCEITAEPTGSVYEALLRLALKRCTTFSLVWRDDAEYGETADRVRERLAPHLELEEVSRAWPGTQFAESEATVRYYRVNDESIGVLCGLPSLFSWSAPAYPEDLAFYDASGRCGLSSSSRNGRAHAWLEVLAYDALRSEVPGLELDER